MRVVMPELLAIGGLHYIEHAREKKFFRDFRRSSSRFLVHVYAERR